MQHLSCPLRRGWAGQCLVPAAPRGVAGGLADPAKMLTEPGAWEPGVELAELGAWEFLAQYRELLSLGVPGTVPRVTDLVYVSFDKFQGLFLS